MLKEGDVVTIYSDPVTEENVEGMAEIVEVLPTLVGSYDGRTMYHCEVRFVVELEGDQDTYGRFVLEPEEA